MKKIRVCFLNLQICDMITLRTVWCCTVTEHKRDIEGLSSGPFKITVCVGLCIVWIMFTSFASIMLSCFIFTCLLLVLSSSVVFPICLYCYLSVMVQSSPAFTPGLRRVSTDTDASNSKSSWLSCPPAEQNISVL